MDIGGGLDTAAEFDFIKEINKGYNRQTGDDEGKDKNAEIERD